jgi:MtN3 and saliva related transmembrane protein
MDATTTIGILAAVLTTAANIPQAVKMIMTRSTKSISAATYAILFGGTTLWTIYGIALDDWPIIIANAISALLSAIILTMKLATKKQENQNDDFPV